MNRNFLPVCILCVLCFFTATGCDEQVPGLTQWGVSETVSSAPSVRIPAVEVVDYREGLTQNGYGRPGRMPVANDPEFALGEPDGMNGEPGSYVRIGYGGYVVLRFPGTVTGNLRVY